jgi:hypothetical protein
MSKRRALAVPTIASEFASVDLGDARRNARAVQIADRIASSPQKSFPLLAVSDAELEAQYRFFSNVEVEDEALLAPHVAATVDRCRAEELVLAIHDSTEFRFPGLREGLVPASKTTSGFMAHFALAVRPGEDRIPLGILALESIFPKHVGQSAFHEQPRRNKVWHYKVPREEKESARWDRGVDAVREAVGATAPVIHVADREADDFAFIAKLVSERARFVIRVKSDKTLSHHPRQKLKPLLENERHFFLREVSISQRGKGTASHPARPERTARLFVRALRDVVCRGTSVAQTKVRSVTLNVVQVFEPKPPGGEEPVEWTLYTSEPVDTPQALEHVVDVYRSRWTVEEFFKALKTGCAYERRQLSSKHALLNALALLAPIAWRLLLLRSVGRSTHGKTPANRMLSERQLLLLRALPSKMKLPPNPTIRDAFLSIASLGGHLRRNGDPGWLTLARGYEELVRADVTLAALERSREL